MFIHEPLSEVIGEHVKNIHSDSQVLMQHAKPDPEVTVAFEHMQQESTAIEKALSDIQLCCRHQTGILDENLDLEKIASEQFEFSHQPFNMAFIVKEIALMVKAKAEKKGLAFSVVSSASPENWVKGDATRIKQIILNLLNNAISFTDQGSISLRLSLPEKKDNQNCFVISVKDTGMGLKEADVSSIFDSYQQANLASGSHYHGSGLGLTIAKQLAQRMGGDLNVKSEWQVGSEFICTLACNRLSTEECALLSQSAAPTSPVARSAGSRHVLVVEDNEINQKCLCFILDKAGHSCVVARDGEAAVSMYQQLHALLDVIFMDTIMPKKNGLEATREIRQFEQAEHLPRKPIISLSGNAQEQDKTAAFQAGVDAYLTKPFNKERVCQLIEQLCSAKGPTASCPSSSSSTPGV